MKNIAIPYARHVQTGEIVDPSQVERGRAANVECLECGERLLARKGQKNIWHFAHEDYSNCSASGESILHFVAKHRLAAAIDRFLPAPDTGNLGRIRIKYGKTEAGIEGEKEGEIVRRADVVLGVDEHSEPVDLHDPLVPEFGGLELAFSYEALHSLGVYIQNLGCLDNVDVVLKHGPSLV